VTQVSYDFSGSVIVITGGASGIGAATARACAAAGASVVVLDVLQNSEKGVESRQVDVGDSGAVRSAVQDIEKRYGTIDAAVLGAAIQQRAPLESITDESWRRHMAVNLDGVFYCMREIAPIMKRQRRGSMLAFTSGLVGMGWAGAAAYTASKGALIGLVKCAAQELRGYGVRVNILSPGVTETPIMSASVGADERAMYEKSIGVSPPEAVVPTVLHLISDASASLTGAVIERRLVPAAS
jgi:NAD(P)-dependent dehydrogenase (short-subunit alcohol dehydrogenase family)